MYEIDFLPVESTSGEGSKSGDAVACRFTVESTGTQAVVVVDGGFSDTGGQLADHISKYFGTATVDLMISTHPDADHLNGLSTALDVLNVQALWMHLPWMHSGGVDEHFSNIEAVRDLAEKAEARHIPITEPFTGLQGFGGQVEVMGPSEGYYKELVEQHLEEERSGYSRGTTSQRPGLIAKGLDLLERMAASLPIETLTDESDVSPRNNSSVVTLIRADDRHLLLTGDAGVEALEYAAEEYEAKFGSFEASPLKFLQAPHHGSKRNLGPTILDRILGPKGSAFQPTTSFISSAKAAPKHPSPKVVNALSRRGASVSATEGRAISSHSGSSSRPGWVPLTPLSALVEDDDD